MVKPELLQHRIGVGLIQNHLFATLSFMPHERQSSGDCQKKRLHEKIYKFENREQ